MAVDAVRLKELDAMVRRMGAIVSVFDVRSSTVGNKHFAAFREVMDVYVDACGRGLMSGHDFLDESVQLNAEEIERLNAAFERVFGAPPQGLSPSGE